MKRTSAVVPCLWIDDSFLDMTTECLKGLYKAVDEVVVVNADRSYSGNVNAGLKACTGDYLIIANNDLIFVQPDWLDHLVKPLEQGCDISSIRTTDSDGWETEDKITEGDKFGSLWCMKREVYEKIGGLDESFGKGYCEDLDYRRRALNEGFKIAKNHAGLVEHKGKATFKVADPNDESYRKALKRYEEKWGFIE